MRSRRVSKQFCDAQSGPVGRSAMTNHFLIANPLVWLHFCRLTCEFDSGGPDRRQASQPKFLCGETTIYRADSTDPFQTACAASYTFEPGSLHGRAIGNHTASNPDPKSPPACRETVCGQDYFLAALRANQTQKYCQRNILDNWSPNSHTVDRDSVPSSDTKRIWSGSSS